MSTKMSTQMLLVLMVSLSCVTSSVVRFVATPSTLKRPVTDQLLMRCALEDTTITRSGDINTLTHTDNPDILDDDGTSRVAAATDIQHLGSIVIMKDHTDLALVSRLSPAKSLDNSTTTQVTGQVVANGLELGYLEVVWSNPGADQIGMYTCVVNGYDGQGHPKTVLQAVEIQEELITMDELVQFINQMKMEERLNKATIASMNNTIQELSGKHNDINENITNMSNNINSNTNNINSNSNKINSNSNKINSNSNNIASMNINITTNTNNIDTCNTNLASLTTQVNTTVIFTAELTNMLNISNDQTVIFDSVILNIGGGYNRTTGKFTCPVAGIYLFHVHVLGNSDKWVRLHIRRNTGGFIAYLQAQEGFGTQSASNSVSVSLNLGDTIYLSSNGDSYLEGVPAYQSTTFTGQLIRQL